MHDAYQNIFSHIKNKGNILITSKNIILYIFRILYRICNQYEHAIFNYKYVHNIRLEFTSLN